MPIFSGVLCGGGPVPGYMCANESPPPVTSQYRCCHASVTLVRSNNVALVIWPQIGNGQFNQTKRPMGWNEMLALSQRPSIEASLAATRLRLLARLRLAPLPLLGLLQTVGAERKAMLFVDLVELRQFVSPALDELPLPQDDS